MKENVERLQRDIELLEQDIFYNNENERSWDMLCLRTVHMLCEAGVSHI